MRLNKLTDRKKCKKHVVAYHDLAQFDDSTQWSWLHLCVVVFFFLSEFYFFNLNVEHAIYSHHPYDVQIKQDKFGIFLLHISITERENQIEWGV